MRFLLLFGDIHQGLGELLPGVSFTCEETYSLTQADVDAATIVNTAFIAGVARDADTTEVRLFR